MIAFGDSVKIDKHIASLLVKQEASQYEETMRVVE